MLAELLLVHLLQLAAVDGLLVAHLLEGCGGLGKMRPEPVGEVGVDALVLFLQRDGQRQHFGFRELVNVSHAGFS